MIWACFAATGPGHFAVTESITNSSVLFFLYLQVKRQAREDVGSEGNSGPREDWNIRGSDGW